MLALTFADKADYDKIQEADTISILGLTEFAPNKPLQMVLNHADGSSDTITVNHSYGIFCLADGKLELISKGLNTTKFRKCKCNDQETALQKIQQWMEKF